MSHPCLLDRNDSTLVVIDVQEAYRGVTVQHERMVRGVRRLIEVAKIVGVPIIATEQYPKGLGRLLAEIRESLPADVEPVEKISLSCWGAARFVEELNASGRKQVLVCGVEAHACVSQTVHDLLDQGFRVHVSLDAISSRHDDDYRTGWDKMLRSGAVPSTVEMACLEWVRTAAAPEFKAVQKIIK